LLFERERLQVFHTHLLCFHTKVSARSQMTRPFQNHVGPPDNAKPRVHRNTSCPACRTPATLATPRTPTQAIRIRIHHPCLECRHPVIRPLACRRKVIHPAYRPVIRQSDRLAFRPVIRRRPE
jgi:hypothetical protein